MNMRTSLFRLVGLACGLLLGSSSLFALHEISGGEFNRLFLGPVPTALPPTTTPQFAGVVAHNASSSAAGLRHATINLAPAADTRLNRDDPTYPSGTDSAVGVYQGRDRTLLRFDLSAIPASSIITNATLRLFAHPSYHANVNRNPIEIYRITQAWVEPNATWNRRTATDSWSQVGGDAVGTTSLSLAQPYATNNSDPGADEAMDWDVAALVRVWANGSTPNHGLMLKLGSGTTCDLHFWSRESSNATLQPTLSITYSLPPPATLPTAPTELYPAGLLNTNGTITGHVLLRSTLGGTFAAGVPRYMFGDVIESPLTQIDGVAPITLGYWRPRPVQPGETFSDVGGLSTPLPPDTVSTVYYSPHADRVFATQSGRVSVTWVTSIPVAIAGDPTLRFRTKTETFNVASSSSKPLRTLFWTERSFNGPTLKTSGGRVDTINPVYSQRFPATVDQEYRPIGYNPSEGASMPDEKRTVWFDKTIGNGELHAYNFEGRVFIEYLGPLVPGATGVHQFLGADVVDVVRSTPTIVTEVDLGQQLTPRDSAGRHLPLDGASEWQPSPILNSSNTGRAYYGTLARADSTFAYFAERENDEPDRVVFYWLEKNDAEIFFTANAPKLGLQWPKQRNSYLHRWSSDLAAYAHVNVGSTGTDPATGLQFPSGLLPEIVWQDDATQTEARLDANTQRVFVTFSSDPLNRTLLKFTSGTEVWYQPLYTQAADRSGYQEGDGAAKINASANVGTAIQPPAGYEAAGYIASGTGYHPAAYRNPFELGAIAANQGAIIPVNARPSDKELKVWWFKKVTAPSAAFQDFYVPAKIGTYGVDYPAAPATIVLASNSGSGDLSSAQIAGGLYYQNNPALPGYNPNEEHAILIADRAYALRDDLNVTTGTDYTSEPFVLVNDTDSATGRPAMKVFKVLREDVTHTFHYPVTAGTILQGPMPLPILPLPLRTNGNVANTEVAATPNPAPDASAPAHYDAFTFIDRKGYHWVYRGPHASGTTPAPTLGMQFYYTMRAGFHIPGLASQPQTGTILPYLRPLTSGVPTGDAVTGSSLTVRYTPTWPVQAPELRVAETLTLPKFGLPAVRGQLSAEVLYQQSIAATGSEKPSVVLHDPTREKVRLLSSTGLAELPASLATSNANGKTYFQGLPPHLQERFFLDPLRGDHGGLVLLGTFVDEIAGEDYLQLNVLSEDDKAMLKGLVAATDTLFSQWSAAIDALTSQVETFIEDKNKAGTYVSNGSPVTVGPAALATIQDSDTAVDSYALTATGKGNGWVTLLIGDGEAFTPEGDPIAMQVFKVAPRLYDGDLKVQLSSNPLDEQVSLRHSGDFAARPQDYDFEWRYAPPQDGIAPPTYTFVTTPAFTAGDVWSRVSSPAGLLPTSAEYAAAPTGVFQQSVTINPVGFGGSTERPGLVLKRNIALDFSSGVPAQLHLTANVDSHTGFVLYINGTPALAFRAPARFTSSQPSTGLVPASTLPHHFKLDSNAFTAGANTLVIALYSTSDAGSTNAINFEFYRSNETDRVSVAGSPWQTPTGTYPGQIVVGGSPTAPLGSPLLVMSDNYFTMRYRPKTGTGNVAGTTWSRWTQPALVEGWIKRVLAAINPFNQRMSDLANNALNTDVSLLTQAGKRWEGDIALSLANINDFGLIEIYETVLNRGKMLSVDAGYDYAPTNDALLLAAGYLADLYTIVGNEAYADAANPTISIDDSATATEVNTSRFSFEGQVASVLQEELSLLAGRDDFLAPGIGIAPAYNRLYWNYTRGINSGEAIYAVNYNIRQKDGSPSHDGKIDAQDAYRMFPQGHGDAYGHYLTALTGYYQLLRNPHFTWTPRSEAVTVLGQAVQIDYFDERKFASAAANVARSAQQILALVHRKDYRDNPAAGWSNFRDGKVNTRTGLTRHWGLDEWSSRATQGAYYHWIAGNAMLPDIDQNTAHTGVQVIDRTTVPELAELTTLAGDFQTRLDNANAHLNPLGLSPGAIAFDISPTELKAGQSHYDQIYGRALQSVLNAKGAFDQAARMTRLLRSQENQLDERNQAIVDQEYDYVVQLKEIYGTPYPGEVGPGKVYAQGYDGPDTYEWFIVDRPSSLVDEAKSITVNSRVLTGVLDFTGFAVDDIKRVFNDEKQFAARTLTLQTNSYVQFSDTWASGTNLGKRALTGTLQHALQDIQAAYLDLKSASTTAANQYKLFERRLDLYAQLVASKIQAASDTATATQKANDLRKSVVGLSFASANLGAAGDMAIVVSDAAQEFVPKVVGLANDVTSPARGGTKLGGAIAGSVLKFAAANLSAAVTSVSFDIEKELEELDSKKLPQIDWSYEQQQLAYEFEQQLRELTGACTEIERSATAYQRAEAQLRNVMAQGERIQAERTYFRQRAAAIIQGYRTKDLTFRTFRNESLEQYRSLFDLASRYTYLAAKSYDYETGLLGSTTGQSVISGIVAARSLGDLTGGVPQATVSTLGDAGLAGTMARMQADWSVAKPRLGINNPDHNGTLFSLRRELFRILDASESNATWQQTLEQHKRANLLADSDVATHCRNLAKPDGSAVPGIVIPFSTTVAPGMNFFGLPLAGGDHAYSVSNYATKVYSLGVVMRGYIGMDPYSIGTPNSGTPNATDPKALSATPYVYLIPTGTDYMLAPPLGDTGTIRAFQVHDQALPLPFNLGATAFSATQFYNANDTLSEQPWILRKHQAFRPVADPAYFYSTLPTEFTSSRLIGRSVWNSGWKLVIPANTLLNNEQEGLNRFVASVSDIELFLRTYSHSGN